jgi:hypothetical protein
MIIPLKAIKGLSRRDHVTLSAAPADTQPIEIAHGFSRVLPLH